MSVEGRLEATEGEVVADCDDKPEDGSGEQESVDAIEDSAVAGKDSTGVFDPGTAFEGRLEKISELGCGIEDYSEDEIDPPGFGGVQPAEALLSEVVAKQDEPHAEDAGGNDGSDGAFPGLVGRELWSELVAAITLADVEGGDVSGPNAEEEEEDEREAIFLVKDLGEQREGIGDVDEKKDPGRGLPEDALE